MIKIKTAASSLSAATDCRELNVLQVTAVSAGQVSAGREFGWRRRLRPLAQRPGSWHSYHVASGRLINFKASHIKDHDDEAQAGLLCAGDSLVKSAAKLLNIRLLFHRSFHFERTRMTDSRLAEFLRSQEGRSVSRETVECLRLLRMFIKLSPAQRREIIELVEQYPER
ncbi:hypothetical protein [Bradyrhizobium sp. UFLA05-112]